MTPASFMGPRRWSRGRWRRGFGPHASAIHHCFFPIAWDLNLWNHTKTIKIPKLFLRCRQRDIAKDQESSFCTVWQEGHRASNVISSWLRCAQSTCDLISSLKRGLGSAWSLVLRFIVFKVRFSSMHLSKIRVWLNFLETLAQFTEVLNVSDYSCYRSIYLS